MTYDEPPTTPGACCDTAPCTCQTQEDAAWWTEWNRRPEGADVSDMFEFHKADCDGRNCTCITPVQTKVK